MPDQAETPETRWPDWLEGLSPAAKVSEILTAREAQVEGGADEPCRLTHAAASTLLMRLLDEARESRNETPVTAVPPEPPLPPGKYGRAELPGRREHTGFIADEIRFGLQCAVVRDWNGAEIACIYGGPGAAIVWLPQPLKRPGLLPELRQEPRRAIGYGFYEADGGPWDDRGDNAVNHAADCDGADCNGDCIPF